jgi:hypothetical protein
MEIVQRLLLEHGLTLADAAAAGDDARDDGFLCEAVWKANRMPPESPFVWNLVEDFFFCFPIRDGSSLLLVGRPEHVAIGRYVGVFLSRTFRALWSAYRSERRLARRSQRPYYQGLKTGIALRLSADRRDLAASRPELDALIRCHTRDVIAEAQRRFPGRIVQGRDLVIADDDQAFGDGVQRGKKIGIRTPLPAPTERRRLTHETQ